jgi:hypothetical protein
MNFENKAIVILDGILGVKKLLLYGVLHYSGVKVKNRK